MCCGRVWRGLKGRWGAWVRVMGKARCEGALQLLGLGKGELWWCKGMGSESIQGTEALREVGDHPFNALSGKSARCVLPLTAGTDTLALDVEEPAVGFRVQIQHGEACARGVVCSSQHARQGNIAVGGWHSIPKCLEGLRVLSVGSGGRGRVRGTALVAVLSGWLCRWAWSTLLHCGQSRRSCGGRGWGWGWGGLQFARHFGVRIGAVWCKDAVDGGGQMWGPEPAWDGHQCGIEQFLERHLMCKFGPFELQQAEDNLLGFDHMPQGHTFQFANAVVLHQTFDNHGCSGAQVGGSKQHARGGGKALRKVQNFQWSSGQGGGFGAKPTELGGVELELKGRIRARIMDGIDGLNVFPAASEHVTH